VVSGWLHASTGFDDISRRRSIDMCITRSES
jgi:hypothetical protein